MGKKEHTDWREARRFRAVELSEQGWSGVAIAEALGVTEGAVSQWLTRAREGGGKAALRARKASGRPPALTCAQKEQLPALLQNGAEHFGFRGEVWTRARVGEVIRRCFGVRYHDSHVGRLLKTLGWTRQKPIRRASERNEAEIERWVAEEWPRIKKKPPPSSAP